MTGEAHPESPADAALLSAAVEVWRASADQTTDIGRETARETEAVSTPVLSETAASATGVLQAAWMDLALNKAGAEAREEAVAAREAAPVRTLLARVLGVHTDERAWRIGADGEERVAANSTRWPRRIPGGGSVHAIPVGNRGSDIDHLVVGPGGVFTVNSKHHPRAKIWVGGNTFMVNGNRVPYVRNSRHEAARAGRLLTAACGFDVRVEGVIVTVNASDITIKQMPKDVTVLPRMQLKRWLLRHGDLLSLDAVESIYAAARRSTTWLQ